MTLFSDSLNKKPSGVFVFIDDDKDEQFLLKMAMEDLGLDDQIVHAWMG